MPVSPTYPGVYIEELPNPVRTIIGVPTAITAFVGPARRGLVNRAVVITSFAEFQREYGGLWPQSLMSYAVSHYYQNGGSTAIIVRIVGANAAFATLDLGGDTLTAASEGAWGNRLWVRFDTNTKDPNDTDLFNLTIRDADTGNQESFRNVSLDPEKGLTLEAALKASRLVAFTGTLNQAPPAHAVVPPGDDPFALDANGDPVVAGAFTPMAGGVDGDQVVDTDYIGGPTGDVDKRGIYALRDADIFNLLCIPPISRTDDIDAGTLAAAAKLCVEERALLIVDPPRDWSDVGAAVTGQTTPLIPGNDAANAAVYFPRIRMQDPLQDNRLDEFPPSGALAGVYASTDVRRGVWKAPAGTEAGLSGVRELTVKLTDLENGRLNPLGVNCLRTFPVIGPVVWGARTMRGADAFADQWKYVPVRRLALFIEESLYRGTQWAVFEPNDEPLWSSIRLNVGAFMNTQFRQGAFAGRSPREAYLVKCDRENNPQNDIDRGIVNVLVGFAPLKPAEFVIIKIQQLAGQLQV
jgi:uncharacterized protein